MIIYVEDYTKIASSYVSEIIMRNYEFYQLDVFTDKLFCGNPLAVFPEADGISDHEMQEIAKEMNLSETVFVLPSNKALRRLRIFTPKQELSLAGHPVVGAWNLLSRLGVVPKTGNGLTQIEQELNLGVLPVKIKFLENDPIEVTMTQGIFEAGITITDENEIAKLAEGLGLKISDLASDRNLPIQVVSTGIKSLDVPVRSLAVLKECKINAATLSDVYIKYGAVGCFPFTFETLEKHSSIHARFFAPADSILEDPATGSAAGALAGYLIHHGAIEKNKFVMEQGDFMNRPSRITAEVTGKKGDVKKVQIGGNSVIAAKGEIFL